MLVCIELCHRNYVVELCCRGLKITKNTVYFSRLAYQIFITTTVFCLQVGNTALSLKNITKMNDICLVMFFSDLFNQINLRKVT